MSERATKSERKKVHDAAVALGSLGGLKGGRSRSKKKKAASARNLENWRLSLRTESA